MEAKEMFEKLGYEFCDLDNYTDFHRYEYAKQTKLENGVRIQNIWFDLINKELYIHNSINLEELQAINQQVKELGWYE